MKRTTGTAGFSLIEVLAAITILGLVTAPLCGALVLAARLSQRSDDLLQARLQVTSAVESLMASGISEDDDFSTLSGVTVLRESSDPDDSAYPAYQVTVTSTAEPDVSITTWIRPAASDDPEGGDAP